MKLFDESRRGFTLIELLTVMGIMVIMSAIAVSSYFGLSRGAAMRSAVNHVRSTLSLARQDAIMHGKRVYVIFEQQAGEPAWFVVCRHEGTVTADIPGGFEDKYTDLRGMQDVGEDFRIYKLDSDRYSDEVTFDDSNLPDHWTVLTGGLSWQVGQRYGWEIAPPVYLPEGIRFGDSGTESEPDNVCFHVDGTIAEAGGYTIEIYEEINPDYVARIHVDFPSGLIRVDM